MSAIAHEQHEKQQSIVNVNLTDTVGWYWYLIGVVLPIVGFIAGIVFMAKSKIGPALALWATCFIAAMTWGGILAVVEYNKAEQAVTEAIEDTPAVEKSNSGLSAYGECIAAAQSAEQISACSDK